MWIWGRFDCVMRRRVHLGQSMVDLGTSMEEYDEDVSGQR